MKYVNKKINEIDVVAVFLGAGILLQCLRWGKKDHP